jgi:hypothetical protein
VDAPPVGESGGEDAMVEDKLCVLRRFGEAADLALEDSATTDDDDTERSNRSKKDLDSMRMERKKKRVETLTSLGLFVCCFLCFFVSSDNDNDDDKRETATLNLRIWAWGSRQ